jgi:flavin reductase (DIM6/NTAB) family NADH-FMN oxidoreductase RutF
MAMSRLTENGDCDPFAHIPGGLFILTAQCEGRHGATLVKWVQQCSDKPPMVMVALPKGLPIELLIQSRPCFALCQISADDRYLIRKFTHPMDNGEDPLVSMMTRLSPGGSPIVDRAMNCLDCSIVRHVELDSDFRIYVGQVHYRVTLNDGTPAICFGGNGLSNGH